MQSIIEVNPFRCRMWNLHDRLEHQINEKNCRGEIESFVRHGQLVPVLGRPLKADPDHDVELIYGARRLFVARHINKPLLVELRDVSDREAIVAMDIENRHRMDVSPYERGTSYARWLRSGHFKSAEDLARSLRVSASQVSRLLKLARLPSVIVAAFPNPVDICEGWGLRLMEALEDPQRRQFTVERARELVREEPRPAPREVYRKLIAASAFSRKSVPDVRDQIIKDTNGAPLFRIRLQSNSIALLLPLEKVSSKSLRDISESVANILQSPLTKQTNLPACRSAERRVDA